jgi:hypothetical protein
LSEPLPLLFVTSARKRDDRLLPSQQKSNDQCGKYKRNTKQEGRQKARDIK